MIVHLPWVKPPLTGNRTRGNPYARAAEVKNAGDALAWVISRAIDDGTCRPVVGAEVTLHFRLGDRRSRDSDGMFPTLKVVLDSLVSAGVLPDDSWTYVPATTCRIHEPNGEPPAMWVEMSDVVEFAEEAPCGA